MKTGRSWRAGMVKCGDKGRHLAIPDNWRLLGAEEVVEKGDKVANIRALRWEALEEDADYDYTDVGKLAGSGVGDFVIRRICFNCKTDLKDKQTACNKCYKIQP